MENYKELSLDERKKIGIGILDDIDNLCKKHKITYYIAYGTLLGAVRHKGFIPWDDDIDIWVPGKQYIKLLEVLEQESNYHLLNHYRDSNWPLYFSKLSAPSTRIVDNKFGLNLKRGVSIDIFPLFECVKEKKQLNKIRRNATMVLRYYEYNNGVYSPKNSLKNLIKKLIVFIDKKIGHDEMYWKKKLVLDETQERESQYIGCPLSPYGIRDIHEKKNFSNCTIVQFEGKRYPAPCGWDAVLKDIYGDYMQLPPKEKRVSNHNVKAYLLEEDK
ncbi:MAG: LicD family protein [Ruminococcus flavefaciens]|nr:LicD family protein [Ruminococcus flavefaciens]